jgi:hypothetical protein
MRAALANALWLASCAPQAARFHLSRRSVQKTQEQVLEGLVRRNRDSAFGCEHGFERVRTPRDFQNQVPLASYDDLRPWIERIEDGEAKVLTKRACPAAGAFGRVKRHPKADSVHGEPQA